MRARKPRPPSGLEISLTAMRAMARMRAPAAAVLWQMVSLQMLDPRYREAGTVSLGPFDAERAGLSPRTLQRGVADLVERGFLRRTTAAHAYTVNPCYIRGYD